jgi:2-dehydro-3-deoxyglucarate aldolase
MIAGNRFKKMLQKNQLTIGSWIQLNSPSAAEIMARSAFDWLTVDMEHSVTSLEMMQHFFQIIEGHNIVPLVRIGENDPNLIKRVMDAGAYGIIVPMINSAADAKKAVDAVKYPPVGNRGVGIARAHGYGRDFDTYVSAANRESVVIAQIEHIEAVKNIKKIIAVDGIDGCFIGPYDLSGSLGMPGNLTHPEVKKAIADVEKACKAKKMPLGIHVVDPDITLMNEYIGRGYTILAFSSDMLLLEKFCRTQMDILREEFPKKKR